MSEHSTLSRIYSVDALRGFALLGILIVHVIEQYYAGPAPSTIKKFLVHNTPDQVVDIITQILIRGKFFAIFSFLFGISFFLQMDSSAKKGEAFVGKFLLRSALLFVIGYVHNLFYRGDILTIYAMLAPLILLFYRASDRVVLAFSGFFLLGGPRLIIWGIRQFTGFPGEENLDSVYAWYYHAAKEGSIWDIFYANATYGFADKVQFQFDSFSRGYLTFGLFLLGMWVGRTRFFERLNENKKLIKKLLFASLGGSIVLVFVVMMTMNGLQDFNSLKAQFGFTLFDLFNNLFGVFLVCCFLLIYLGTKGQKVLNRLVPYGKMALTNYFFQSVIGTFIFFGWGLGMLNNWGAAPNLGIAILIYIAQLSFSKWWLKRYQYGPLEWLWRSGTQRAWAPLRRESVVEV
jgi:uncharacterized protein